MIKKLVKYFLTLSVLLIDGTDYLSAASLFPESTTRVSITQHADFAFKSAPSGTENKIDVAENKIEEDESDLPIRFVESFNYSPAFQAQTVDFFIPDSKKDIPFYLMFCTIRI